MSIRVRKRTCNCDTCKARARANKAESLLRLAIVYLESALEREQENHQPSIRPEHLKKFRAWQKDEK